ncbi:MAG: hypothetical protein JST86_00765 [Bacteroidetes bacterium]|nr:hypothetical protein [Bacteroidota bacterium]
MKRLIVFITVCLSLLFVSCNSRVALDFNQKLVSLQKEVITKAESMNGVSRDSVEKWALFNNYLKQRISDMKALKAPEGGDDFKEAMLNDIYGLADAIELKAKIYQNQNNEDGGISLAQQFDSLKTVLKKLDQRVIMEQRKFAKANNFRLEK